MSHALKLIFRCLLITFAMAASVAFANLDDEFIVWQPIPGGPRYVLPKIPGLPPWELAQRWQEAVRKSKVYGGMENTKFLRLSTDPSTFSKLPRSSAEHPNVLVVLNRPNQMTTKSGYLKTVVKSFEHEGPNLLSIPIGLETVLTPQQMKQMRRNMNQFDGQLGVGGDDPHPHTFNNPDTSQALGDISAERDEEQMEYMREYMDNGKGRVFYICGSMQRAAILDGHGFHCDIGHLTKTAQRGKDKPVMLEVQADPNSELAKAAQSTRFQTSNFHHAGVDGTSVQDPNKLPNSQITSYNIEGDGTRGLIPKSIEFPNNTGFATQFHPEFRGSPEEENIVRYVSTGWKMRGRYTPDDVMNCVERRLDSMLSNSGSPP